MLPQDAEGLPIWKRLTARGFAIHRRDEVLFRCVLWADVWLRANRWGLMLNAVRSGAMEAVR